MINVYFLILPSLLIIISLLLFIIGFKKDNWSNHPRRELLGTFTKKKKYWSTDQKKKYIEVYYCILLIYL